MPNIASVLKAEIARIARRETRSAVESLRKTSASQRAEIATLKRRIQELEREIKRRPRQRDLTEREAPAGATGMRFRAAGMAANRERLGLTPRQFGQLVGVSAQTINGWEQRKSKPDAAQLAIVASLRGISKTQVAERLAAASAR